MNKIVYQLNNNKIVSKTKLNREYLRQIVLSSIKETLGLTVLVNDYITDKETNEKIETLAVDENYQLVLVEYRIGYNTRVINNGLFEMDYITNHLSEFKMLVNERLKDKAKNVNYKPRLIVVSDNFNKNDGYSISKLPYDIDLITLNIFDNIVEVNKLYTSRNIYINEFISKLNENERFVLNYLNEYVLSLGDEISINGFLNVVIYRSIKTFMYVIYDNGLKLIINNKCISLNSIDDVDNNEKLIEDAYDK